MSPRLIIVIVMLAASLLVGFFLTWPEYQKFSQLQVEFGQKKAELDSKTDYYSEIMNIWSRLEQYQDSLTQIERAVSNGYSLPAIFDSLKQLAGQTGLVLEDLSFAGITGEAIKEISFNVQVSGTYSAFKNFLGALESSGRIFNVKNISFSSPEKGNFSFEISVITYSY